MNIGVPCSVVPMFLGSQNKAIYIRHTEHGTRHTTSGTQHFLLKRIITKNSKTQPSFLTVPLLIHDRKPMEVIHPSGTNTPGLHRHRLQAVEF